MHTYWLWKQAKFESSKHANGNLRKMETNYWINEDDEKKIGWIARCKSFKHEHIRGTEKKFKGNEKEGGKPMSRRAEEEKKNMQYM